MGGKVRKGWRDTKSKLFGEILKRDRSEKSGAFSEDSLRGERACEPVRPCVRVHVHVCVRRIHPWNFPPSTLACLLIST